MRQVPSGAEKAEYNYGCECRMCKLRYAERVQWLIEASAFVSKNCTHVPTDRVVPLVVTVANLIDQNVEPWPEPQHVMWILPEQETHLVRVDQTLRN